jgi:tetratricopeptide (TPR) repeat protein
VGALPGFEHRMYLPLVGFAIAALETDWLRRLDPRRPAVAALAGVVIVGFSTISFLRCQTFRDFETFWSHALADSPHSRVAHLIYGAKLMERGRLYDAGAVFTTYLERGGDAQGIHHGLGLVHAARGRTALAQRQFEAEFEISPGFADAQLQLGGVYAKSGRGEQAVALWNEILAQDPDFGPAYQALLSYHRSRGDAERAKQVAERMRRRGIREP